MKIGIITILKVNNYGAELQAYATQAILKNLGYNAEIIDYLFYKNPNHKSSKLSQPLFKYSLKKKVAEFIYPIMDKVKKIKHRKIAAQRARKFEDFHNSFTSLSKTFRSVDDLYNTTFDYDIYLTGSDQVWNPGIYSSIAPYFLDFAPLEKKRISYAASFGVSKIPKECIDTYKNSLEKYSAIGVREKDAVNLIESNFNLKAEWVLDPTLLLSKEEWLKVTKKVHLPSQKYLLVYELTSCPYIIELSKYISKIRGYKIIRICKDSAPVEKNESIINIVDAGPSEFLHLFANASFVITNSFHGTAFAINFNQPFYVVLPKRKQNNSRQKSLLNLLELSEKYMIEGSNFPKDSHWDIDYTHVNQKLDKERKNSIKFLIDSINGK